MISLKLTVTPNNMKTDSEIHINVYIQSSEGEMFMIILYSDDKEIDENCVFEVPSLKYYGNFDRKIFQIFFSSFLSIILGQKYFTDFMDARIFGKGD